MILLNFITFMLINFKICLLQICGLPLLVSAFNVFAQEVLEEFSCNFVSPCCWHPQANSSSMLFINDEPIDKRWYAKTFRVGSHRRPPAYSHLKIVASLQSESSVFESCEICSATGLVEISFRHWQSTTASLELCWRDAIALSEEREIDHHYCLAIDPYLQFNTDPIAIKVADRKPIVLYFRVRNRSSSGRLLAVVLIDYIGINTDPCPLNILSSHSNNMNRLLPSDPTIVLQNHGKKSQSKETLFSTQAKSVDIPVKGKKGLKKIALADITATFHSAFPQSPVAVNPFVELFGQDFAEFLDPNFNTSKYELTEQKLSTGDKHDMVPSTSTKFLFTYPSTCETEGGCLFERSTCGYINSKLLANKGIFRRVKIENSHFIEARIQPGQVAVFEKDVNMSDTSYNILFDHLEWSQMQSGYTKIGKGGEKLSICCFAENKQPFETHCPFENKSGAVEEKDALNWKSDKFVCPQHTTKLIFICENYGTEVSACALDNIRLHKQEDIEFVEPCQKNRLAFL